jgi:hypothetical protein
VSWLVIKIGCLECGVNSNVVGVFESKEQAELIATTLGKTKTCRGEKVET